jgi:tRNA1Val (adenine37-N6)-methyltransferase
MANTFFQFKQFTIHQDKTAMKVTTDACLFGAWIAGNLGPEAGSVLDIGTGTGLLALMLAQAVNVPVDAIEIDQDAVEQATGNIIASPWAGRIKVLHADAKVFAFDHPYDVIISNPPFYEKELQGDDRKKNIAHHDAGLLLPELLTIIKENLSLPGHFFLLLPFKRNKEIRELLSEQQLVPEQITFVRQTVSHDYFRVMIAGKLKNEMPAQTSINEIAIKGDKGEYTAGFIQLLKEYYLHL